MKRSAHSFTLIETLLALSLASLALTIALTWMIAGLRASLRLQEQTRWEQAARALLQLIHDDVTAGVGSPAARVEIGEDWLRVATLGSSGSVEQVYVYKPSRREIHLSGGLPTTKENGEAEVVLGNVTSVQFSHWRDPPVLRVVLRGPHTLTREYPLLP
jgi:type II secretory pathway pseudopilin PulG